MWWKRYEHILEKKPVSGAEAIKDLTVARRLEPKKAVYAFHLALAEEKLGGPKTNRDFALAAARGLTKAKLHAKEWPDFDRLLAK